MRRADRAVVARPRDPPRTQTRKLPERLGIMPTYLERLYCIDPSYACASHLEADNVGRRSDRALAVRHVAQAVDGEPQHLAQMASRSTSKYQVGNAAAGSDCPQGRGSERNHAIGHHELSA